MIATRSARARNRARGKPPDVTTSHGVKTICAFGARGGPKLLARLQMHLETARYLAQRRGDLVWEAGCDYAAMTLARLESQFALEKAAASRGGVWGWL